MKGGLEDRSEMDWRGFEGVVRQRFVRGVGEGLRNIFEWPVVSSVAMIWAGDEG